MQKSNNVLYVVKIALVLLLICGVMAGLLALVNGFTADKIAANEAAKELAAISEIFGEGITLTAVEGELSGDITKLQKAERAGTVAGYAVNVTGSGFGGDIEMIVGVSGSGEVLGVKILSMSETPGLGSKAGVASFLDQFKGNTGPFSVSGNIDAISGATVSSKAVAAAVNAALEAIKVEVQ